MVVQRMTEKPDADTRGRGVGAAEGANDPTSEPRRGGNRWESRIERAAGSPAPQAPPLVYPFPPRPRPLEAPPRHRCKAVAQIPASRVPWRQSAGARQ